VLARELATEVSQSIPSLPTAIDGAEVFTDLHSNDSLRKQAIANGVMSRMSNSDRSTSTLLPNVEASGKHISILP
jgi:hypothetical protein